MCYMESVGVRELRQNASELLDRVQAGESFEITNHGRPVARLVGIGTRGTASYAELVGQGLLQPGRGDPLAVIPVQRPAGSPSTSALLAQDRDQDE